MSEEKVEGAEKAKDDVIEEVAERPRFRPQGQEGLEDKSDEEPAKPREEGSTGVVKKPSVGERDPEARLGVDADFLAMLSESSEAAMFGGKRMTVVLGLGSKYIFDADKIPKAMKKGAAIRTIETADDIVVGRVGDARVDPVKAKADKALREARNARNVDAVALQAAAVLAAREKGSTEPTAPVPAVIRQFKGNGALIVAERLDALNDVDLKAFAERRTREVSVAACKLMSFGLESPDPTRAAEAMRDAAMAADSASAEAGKGPEGSEAAATPGPADAGKTPEAGDDAGKAAETAPSDVSTVKVDVTEASPVEAVVTPAEEVGRPQPAANDPQATANDHAPKTLAEQAKMVSGEPHDVAQSKGPTEAANDASVVIAMGDRSKGRD